MVRGRAGPGDGQRQDRALTATRFPSYEQIRAGTGTIRIEARAALGAPPAGQHSLLFQNHHRPDLAVYQVNALLPASRAIAITEQHRDSRQRALRLRFNLEPALARSRAPQWLLAAALALLLSTLIGYGYRWYAARRVASCIASSWHRSCFSFSSAPRGQAGVGWETSGGTCIQSLWHKG